MALSDENKLREYLDGKLLLGKIDTLLLFLSSSISITFAIGNAILGVEWVAYFLPLIFLGWFMPVYIGYIRGAIIPVQYPVTERIRGWIYLIAGAGTYFINPILFALSISFMIINPLLGLLVNLLLYVTFIYVLTTFTLTLVKKLFRIRWQATPTFVHEAFTRTQAAAILLGTALQRFPEMAKLAFHLNGDWLKWVEQSYLLLMWMLAGFVVAFICEINARKVLRTRVCVAKIRKPEEK